MRTYTQLNNATESKEVFTRLLPGWRKQPMLLAAWAYLHGSPAWATDRRRQDVMQDDIFAFEGLLGYNELKTHLMKYSKHNSTIAIRLDLALTWSDLDSGSGLNP